jgi:hypothetical protein
VATGQERRRFRLVPRPAGVIDSDGDLAFAPDGLRLALAQGEVIQLWNLASGKVERRFVGHGNAVSYVAFSADGKLLASASQDETVRLWDVATGEELAALEGHRGPVSRLAFSRDGKRLISSSVDTTALVWDVRGAIEAARRRRPVSRLAGESPETWWDDLAGADAGRAYLAMWRLVDEPRQTVALLDERLRPARPVDADYIRRLLAELDSPQFLARQRASTGFVRLGDLAEGALRGVLTGHGSAEVRRRAEQLLRRLEEMVPTGETVRGLRAVEVLEHIGTADAARVLARLAEGAPEARLTHEAKAALERMHGGHAEATRVSQAGRASVGASARRGRYGER